MPKKQRIAKAKHKKLTKSHHSDQVWNVFTEDKSKLHLILFAFITLSVLLLLHNINQSEELDGYKKAEASTKSR